ncbi:MAG: hypothetical protein QKB75_gp2 [Bacilladnaviridae sp.]|uniref:Uncharacterized protein n=1 Tax=Bacilladnaviridae sp. isolate ctia23 TaxID=3070178 RepID=A0A345N324_9VIRU|nr:MAG: hypothetical protein QKB75_gp2 [Bacilladnaviridae sp.]AXH78024.1 MAG: hypothetical protein [Bacilladnaviridae sp. isolate ctia23]
MSALENPLVTTPSMSTVNRVNTHDYLNLGDLLLPLFFLFFSFFPVSKLTPSLRVASLSPLSKSPPRFVSPSLRVAYKLVGNFSRIESLHKRYRA